MESDAYCVNEPSVISEIVDGETIVLNFESGHYYSFNATASAIWTRMRAGEPVTAVTAWVARRFGVDPPTIQNELTAFVRRLEEERLIRRVAAGTVPAAPAVADGPDDPVPAFSSPDFEKFTDMEELLLLDPIHEVGDAGWPRKS